MCGFVCVCSFLTIDYFPSRNYPQVSSFLVNPYWPSGPFHPYTLDESICHFKGVRVLCILFSYHFILIEIPVTKLCINSANPGQMPCSDLDLHCLPMSLLQDARHEWVTNTIQSGLFLGIGPFKCHETRAGVYKTLCPQQLASNSK